MITTMEAKLALGIEAGTDELFDLIDEAVNNLPDSTSHENPLVNQLATYFKKRQVVRIVRRSATDRNGNPTGKFDPNDDKLYVYHENVLDPAIHKFDRLLYPACISGEDKHFEDTLSGHVQFIYMKHLDNGAIWGQSNPNSWFSNWADFPELNSQRVFAFDCKEDYLSGEVDQRPSAYLL